MIASFVRQWYVCPGKAELISRINKNNLVSGIESKTGIYLNGASIEEQGEKLWEKL